MLLNDRRFGEMPDVAAILKMAGDAVTIIDQAVDIGIGIADRAEGKKTGSTASTPAPQPAPAQQAQPAQSQPQTPTGQNVQGLGSSLNTNTVLMVGGGVAALGLLAVLFTRKKR